MAVIDLGTGDVLGDVVLEKGTTIVDFYAEWCGPCKALGPVLGEIDSENNDIEIVKVNFEDHIDLATEFQVMSVPMLVIFKDGQVVDTITGALPKPQLVKRLGL